MPSPKNNNEEDDEFQFRAIKKHPTENTPLIFTRGVIEIDLVQENQGVRVTIPKLINYSEENMRRLSCLIIGTKEPVEKDKIEL